MSEHENRPSDPGLVCIPRREKVSMHDDVETWEDCCVCEPEPRWQQLAEEMEEERRRQSPEPEANHDADDVDAPPGAE